MGDFQYRAEKDKYEVSKVIFATKNQIILLRFLYILKMTP